MNISSSNAMIYAKEFNGKMRYRTAIVKKNDDNKYDRAYIDVKMPKNTQLEDKTKVRITKGFISFYKSKDDKDVFYLVVQEYEKVMELKEQPVYKVESYTTEQLDLPF